MNVTRPILISAGAVAAMLALSAWSYPHIPNAPIAVHWGLDGQPNGFATKDAALFMMPALAALFSAILATLPQIMPRRSRLERSALPYGVTWLGILLLLFLCHGVVIGKGMGSDFDVARPLTTGVAVLMLAIGNYMGKIRYNYVFGVRTPWTLANERVWDKTHRFAGRCMVGSAFVLVALALFTPPGMAADRVLVSAMTLCAIGPAIAAALFSLLCSRRFEHAGS